MNKPVLITTPIPTFDEVVKDLGISDERRDSIIRIMSNRSRPRKRSTRNQSQSEAQSGENTQKSA